MDLSYTIYIYVVVKNVFHSIKISLSTLLYYFLTGAFKCNISSPSFNTIEVSCELLGNLTRVNVTLKCTGCTSSSEYHTTVNDSPIVISNLPGGNYTVNVTAVDVNIRTVEVIMVFDDVTTTTTSTNHYCNNIVYVCNYKNSYVCSDYLCTCTHFKNTCNAPIYVNNDIIHTYVIS